MSRESLFPYPPRPGTAMDSIDFDAIDPRRRLSLEAIEDVMDFEQQLYQVHLDPLAFPEAEAYKQTQAEAGQAMLGFEESWRKKINSTTLGSTFFLTNEGRALLRKSTGHELAGGTLSDVEASLASLDLSGINSKVLDKLSADSVEHEELRLTLVFTDAGYAGDAIPEPTFLELYKNPAVILEKARGYRQFKHYITRAISDLEKLLPTDDHGRLDAKIELAKMYRHRVNSFIAANYVDAYKFAYQVSLSGSPEQVTVLEELEAYLPAFYINRDGTQTAGFLQRMDRYRHGVSLDENERFTWLSPEAKALADTARNEREPELVERTLFEDIDPEEFNNTEIDGETFGDWLRGVLSDYDLLSEHIEWDSERDTAAPDGKWQVIVDAQFKSLSVASKQMVVKVPAKDVTLLRAVSTGNHELTHVLQHHNKRLIGKLAILRDIGLDNASEQTESGGVWQEKVAKEQMTGVKDNSVNGTGYYKTLGAKADGNSFGEQVQLYFEDVRFRNPYKKPDDAAREAVNRARRAFRSGGFEYAQDLPVLTNTQPLSYLEQGLIYRNLTDQQRRLLFIAGITFANTIRLAQVGLTDLDQVFIPEKMPWELLEPKVREVLKAKQSA